MTTGRFYTAAIAEELDLIPVEGTTNLAIQVPSIGTVESFGSNTTSFGVILSGIISEEAIPSPYQGFSVQVEGIASTESTNTPDVFYDLFITYDGIVTEESIGSGATKFKATSTSVINYNEFGTSKSIFKALAGDIASQEAIGVSSAILKITPTGMVSEEVIGSSRVDLFSIIRPAGIAGQEQIGVLKTKAWVQPSAIDPEEQVNTPVAHPVRTLTLTGIASTAVVPSAAVIKRTIAPASINSAETFSSPKLNFRVRASSAATSEAIGVSQLNFKVTVPSIASTYTVPAPQAAYTQEIIAPPILKQEAFGSHVVKPYFIFHPASIASTSEVGTFKSTIKGRTTGIPTKEQFGTHAVYVAVDETFYPASILTEESFNDEDFVVYITEAGLTQYDVRMRIAIRTLSEIRDTFVNSPEARRDIRNAIYSISIAVPVALNRTQASYAIKAKSEAALALKVMESVGLGSGHPVLESEMSTEYYHLSKAVYWASQGMLS